MFSRALPSALQSGNYNATDSEEEEGGAQQSQLHEPVGSNRWGQKNAIDVEGVESSKRQSDVPEARSNDLTGTFCTKWKEREST